MKSRLLVAALAVFMFGAMAAQADVVYSSIPSTIPPNVVSLGYQATSTQEFGNSIGLGGTARNLTTISVLMSNWAVESTYEQVGLSQGFTHSLTLNLYNSDLSGNLGSLFATETIDAFIPWRPEADGSCGSGYKASDGNCYNGLATTVVFDFTAQGITLPDNLVFGLAFNTETHGYSPIGAPGPYNSLNFGVEGGSPTVGTLINPDSAYWNTSFAGFYTDGGAGGVGTFRQDTNWTPYAGQIEINAVETPVPEPASMMLFGTGLAGLAGVVRRKLNK
jgi:hypothetical protein